MGAKSPPDQTAKPSKQATRQLLIFAGEKLFAEEGIDAVSLRQVNNAAGQKNSSASHYHFGSKEGLIQAIYDFRMERVNTRRLELNAKIKADGLTDDVRALVEAIVYPIVEEMYEKDAEHYIQFMAQATSHPANYVRSLSESTYAEGLQQTVSMLRNMSPDMPRDIFGQRFGLMIATTIHALADYNQIMPDSMARTKEGMVTYVSNLVDMLAGAFIAPVSQDTIDALAKSHKRKA